MSEKFKDKSDNELVLLYKNSRNDDVEFEIIARYQRHAKKLAREQYNKFNFLYQVEYDDLYCICLSALFNAIRSFDDDSINFYSYWKTAAINEATSYVSKFTNIHKSRIDDYLNYEQGICMSGYLKEKTQNTDEDYLSSIDLENVLSNPKNKFSKTDVDVFRLYLAGYSINDIAALINSTYSKERYRIDNIRRKLANILFNQ